MLRTYEVAVIGLGVMGTAILRELARAGTRACGLERFDVPHALGSSHGHSRVIRTAYFEDARYVPLLSRSFELWEELERESGRDLLRRAEAIHMGHPDHDGMRGVLAACTAHGLDFEVLEPNEVTLRYPGLTPGKAMVGIAERTAGILSPEACVSALATSAARHGATIVARTEVTGLAPGRDGIVVHTTRGEFFARAVVLSPGAWLAGTVAGLACPFPLTVERQTQLWFGEHTPRWDQIPVFIAFTAEGAFYGMPPHGVPGVKVCRHHDGEATTAADLDRRFRPEDEADVRAFVAKHLPSANGPLLGARVCMYTNTPDGHFVIGAHPTEPNIFVAGGFSGHGFKLAPVVGEMIADHVKGGAMRHDIDLFDPMRFA